MKRQIANPSTFFVILAAFMLLAVQSDLWSNGLNRPGYGRVSSCRRVIDP